MQGKTPLFQKSQIGVCQLTAKDVVRHPLVMRIIRAYEQAEEKPEKQVPAKEKNER